MFLLSYILALISFKFINAKEENIYCLFIVGGVLANFFDFLTFETLVFTLPFLIIYYFRYKDKKVDKKAFIFFIKSALAFLLSYSLMWLLKWLILVVFFKQSPSSFLNEHLIERGINEDTFKLGFFDSIIINLRQLIPFCFFDDIVVIIVSIIYILFLIYNFVRKKFGLYEFILVCISLIPIIRYLVMFMHSYDHYFFTYRALLSSIIVFFIILKIWLCSFRKINSWRSVVMKKDIELTILMPCLNEEETVGICIKKAFKFLNTHNIKGEVLIIDNNSTDNSSKIAKELGARVILEKNKGYGNALRRGLKEAYGKYVIFGDCDDSYDFLNLEPFLDKLREGYSLVNGNRFKGGVF